MIVDKQWNLVVQEHSCLKTETQIDRVDMAYGHLSSIPCCKCTELQDVGTQSLFSTFQLTEHNLSPLISQCGNLNIHTNPLYCCIWEWQNLFSQLLALPNVPGRTGCNITSPRSGAISLNDRMHSLRWPSPLCALFFRTGRMTQTPILIQVSRRTECKTSRTVSRALPIFHW